MLCPKCGNEIKDDSQFCPYCGVKVCFEEETKINNQNKFYKEFEKANEMLYGVGGEKQDTKKSVQKIFELADNHNQPDALLKCGWFYQFGEYVEKDYKKAFNYYLRSANLGNELAMILVGYLSEFGLGVDRNVELATKYYKAVKKKERIANLFLKRMEDEAEYLLNNADNGEDKDEEGI